MNYIEEDIRIKDRHHEVQLRFRLTLRTIIIRAHLQGVPGLQVITPIIVNAHHSGSVPMVALMDDLTGPPWLLDLLQIYHGASQEDTFFRNAYQATLLLEAMQKIEARLAEIQIDPKVILVRAGALWRRATVTRKLQTKMTIQVQGQEQILKLTRNGWGNDSFQLIDWPTMIKVPE